MKETTEQVRSFNRFYTSHIGLLNQHFLESPYSLTEVRILHEIGEHKSITAQNLSEILNLDKGYVSRILKLFLKSNVISKLKSKEDGRAYFIELTDIGKKLLKELHAKQNNQIDSFVDPLNSDEQNMLVNSMRTIKNLLVTNYDNRILAQDVTFRQGLKPGDIGYLIYLHGILYSKESGYSQQFEAYVAKTFYDFFEHYSPEHDRIWLAEYNQQIIGSVAIINHSEHEVQLRWFLTHPVFRGTGIGKKLLNTALDYCRERNYKNVFLLTTSVQQRAIEMYKKAGFVQTQATELNQWGKTMHEERFDLNLE
ncbi:bifunctional helix-turn-helix transcriptional regulator/GNAT family N-acetyltransferase [Elizabethkingia meningoseptica]|uniref:GNAT family N-acetyltransferase n=3 Tax=Elizabethkingia meningoseptica TaxID=238 RepID=A0A1V3U2W3_ELIME|nr:MULTISPECIES: bifunctional helix-turn-helix transcriptional regulator/GNAT family N-acetyltransferase [Elizabethkingia]AQX04791.1 GCN5 family acetyltransferase [Elizabethkingia meningoseptica]AQX12252.1 GCN5 family acetyltransferase [Elizabethkingia meningoseptica]AQX46833.1 GCN5 family acetyltransferase [Elizabethkingia meningoseptica]EJK5330767.1 bifunctional helix-turn-helix transcriptional regulator/GNAT family N-acetyltransferase [Elizabethkingia meningoseptica]EOR29552.1 N-acetyltrans